MLRIVQPLFQEDNDKERRHRKFDALCIDGEACTDETSDGRACDPVKLVQQGDKEHKPARINAVRNLCCVVDREGFIAHAIDEIGFFPACTAILFKHGNTVEDMTCLNHECEEEGLERCKRTEEECRCNEFE